MNYELKSQSNGKEIIDKGLQAQLLELIEQLQFEITKGCGDELREAILSKLKLDGWSHKFKLDNQSKISLTSYKNGVVLCFQTGNMGRFYADLLKLEYVYRNKKVDSVIYLIPSKSAAKLIGSNIANYERFIYEFDLFKDIITIPSLIIGIY